MVNNGQGTWPSDTRMELIDKTPGLKIVERINLGAEVPSKSQVKVQFTLDFGGSTAAVHSF